MFVHWLPGFISFHNRRENKNVYLELDVPPHGELEVVVKEGITCREVNVCFRR